MKIQIDVMEKKTEEIELPPLDKEDVVWQLRTFEDFMIVLTQNRMILKTVTDWHVIDSAAGMMDCVRIGQTPQLAISHISGDVLMFDTEQIRVDAAYMPETPVIGRKLGADSHMMLLKGSNLYVARPEGLVDHVKV